MTYLWWRVIAHLGAWEVRRHWDNMNWWCMKNHPFRDPLLHDPRKFSSTIECVWNGPDCKVVGSCHVTFKGVILITHNLRVIWSWWNFAPTLVQYTSHPPNELALSHLGPTNSLHHRPTHLMNGWHRRGSVCYVCWKCPIFATGPTISTLPPIWPIHLLLYWIENLNIDAFQNH